MKKIMGLALQIIPLSRDTQDIRRFLRVSERIYRDDPFWVAPLWLDIRKQFSDGNPFLNHAEMALWIASRDGEDVGRVAGIFDRLRQDPPGERTAYFGFFETQRDPEVSHALFEVVSSWAQHKGADLLVGPMNPSANDECGLLVKGFEQPPVLLMSYNPGYYEELVLAAGFNKAKDLLAYHIDLAGCPLNRIDRLVERFRRRKSNLRLRPIRRRTLAQDLPKIKEVYNEAWSRNWGFVPMTDAEVDYMAKRLGPLLTEGISWLAETPEGPVGFLLALPDYNEAIKPLRGRLFTPKLAGLLPYLLGRKLPTTARVIALGVKERFRGRGIETTMLGEALRVGARLGFRQAEASWVLEENVATRQTIEAFGGKPHKTYRLYQRRLSGTTWGAQAGAP
ncbi:MAG: N-acetyltransferase family protein [Verrucomicrobiia bacterium]